MILNYLKVALRNLRRHSSFSFINIFGLSASLSVCLLAIMLIKDAHSFDQFHPEGDRVYRILTDAIRKSGGEESYASSPFMVGKTLMEDYSQVESWVPLVRTFDSDIRTEGGIIGSAGLFTDGAFFEVFGFDLAEGDPLTALETPYSVVLTDELASRIFPQGNALGQALELPAYDTEFKVTGVLRQAAGKTHLEFGALGSLSTQLALEQRTDAPGTMSQWQNYYMSYNFVRLKSDADLGLVEAALEDLVQTHYSDLDLETRDAGYRFRLQPLGSITPGPFMSNNMGGGLPQPVLWFFSGLCLVVMFSACFNYTNLTVARSLTRAKEVGVRKVMGANRGQIFGQFISEALLTALVALGIGYLILQLTIPAFNSLKLFADTDITFKMDGPAVVIFTGFALLTGLVAGLLPALALSKFSPLVIMQRLENMRLFRRIGLRKVLIVSQLTISLIFILLLTIAWRQMDYSITENFGSDRTDLLNVQMQGHTFEQLSAAFGQIPQVENISACSHLMGTWQDGSDDVRTDLATEPIGVRDYVIDQNFIENMGLELIAGENFPENPNQQQELFAIVNEQFLEKFELGNPVEAIGQALILGDSTQVAIRGVVKDFLYKPLIYNIEPLLLRYRPDRLSVLNLSLSAADMPTTIAALERTWKNLDTERPFQYQFYDETVTENFAEMKDVAKVVGYFGLLGILIACLGLLGMAIYSVETRAKEVSIRKVIGAGASDLVLLLSKGYFWLLLIAVLLATPISFFLGNLLLQAFAFSIPLNAWVFLPGVGGLLVLGALTIGSQTVRAALANPVNNLKDE